MTALEIFRESPITHLHISKHGYKVPGLKVVATKYVEKPEFIIGTVLKYFGFTFLHEITIKSKKREFVYPRQVCFYLLSKYSGLSLKEIGAMVGHKDHTTVIHNRDLIKDLMDTDDKVYNEIEYLESLIMERSFMLQRSKQDK